VPAQVWGALVSGSPGGATGSVFDLAAPAPARAVRSGSAPGTAAPPPAPAPKPACHGHKCRR
jgi:hypothetical protein